jgi:type VI secretion system protein ImpA
MYSAEDLQKPPIIDFEMLLQPISEENPSGESVRYEGVYDELAEARRADDDLSMGKWQMELKVADFPKVIELADYTLKTQTKDLQIAAWFSEALTALHGFTGLRDSLKLLAGLQEIFWDTLYPEVDEGDMEARANALAWIDDQAALLIKKNPLTSEGLNYLDWDESKNFDIPENIDTLEYSDQERYKELKAQAEAENRVTGDMWRKAKAGTKRAFCEELHFAIVECQTEYQNLTRVIEEKFDMKQAPAMRGMRDALEEIESAVKRLLDDKRQEEPDEIEETEIGEDETENAEGVAVAGGVTVAKGAIQSRKDALKRLAEIADYFQKTEPHSPVAYLVNRAVKWGNMSLETWLQDVIKDENIIFQLRQTLGFNTSLGGEESPPIDESL